MEWEDLRTSPVPPGSEWQGGELGEILSQPCLSGSPQGLATQWPFQSPFLEALKLRYSFSWDLPGSGKWTELSQQCSLPIFIVT